MGAQYLAQRAPTPASCQLGARALNNCVTPPILSSGCWRGRPGELPGPGCRPSRHRFDLLEKKEGEQRGLGCGRRAAHPRGFGCWSGEPRLRPHTPHAGPRELHGASSTARAPRRAPPSAAHAHTFFAGAAAHALIRSKLIILLAPLLECEYYTTFQCLSSSAH
jgi:hypothetical protein